jgi:hypothetical protein
MHLGIGVKAVRKDVEECSDGRQRFQGDEEAGLEGRALQAKNTFHLRHGKYDYDRHVFRRHA